MKAETAEQITMDTGSAIPKIIWTMWYQGIDEAPDLVRRCLFSWKEHNPDWKLIFLDKNNLQEHLDLHDVIDVNRKDISIQKVSNIIRINLLAKYGGVWVDGDCLCLRPLKDWLYDYVTSGFFAFRNPGRDRILASWFLVSGRNCHLTMQLSSEHTLFWKQNYFSNQNNIFGKLVCVIARQVLRQNRSITKWWLSSLFTKAFKVYPYFILHYHAANIIREDSISREIWEQTPEFSAKIPLRWNLDMYQSMTEEKKHEIESQNSPMYKLKWKLDQKRPLEGSVLDYLLNSTADIEE